jgi:hypothetical protein
MQSDIYLDAHRALDWLPVSLVRTLTRATWVARQLRRSEPYSSWGGRRSDGEARLQCGAARRRVAQGRPRRARPSERIHILAMVCGGRFQLSPIRVGAAVEVTARRGCSVGLCAAELPRVPVRSPKGPCELQGHGTGETSQATETKD